MPTVKRHPDLEYVVSWYPSYYKGGKKRLAACGCMRYGGSCYLALEAKEPVVVVISWANRQRGWKKAVRWRKDCFKRHWPLFIDDWAKAQKEHIEAIDLEYSGLYEKRTGNKQAKGRPKAADAYGLTEEQVVERKKLIALHSAYRFRLKKVMTGSSSKKFVQVDKILAGLRRIEVVLGELGGVPKKWSVHEGPMTPAQIMYHSLGPTDNNTEGGE